MTARAGGARRKADGARGEVAATAGERGAGVRRSAAARAGMTPGSARAASIRLRQVFDANPCRSSYDSTHDRSPRSTTPEFDVQSAARRQGDRRRRLDHRCRGGARLQPARDQPAAASASSSARRRARRAGRAAASGSPKPGRVLARHAPAVTTALDAAAGELAELRGSARRARAARRRSRRRRRRSCRGCSPTSPRSTRASTSRTSRPSRPRPSRRCARIAPTSP